jgi:hypothetical protein
MKPLKYVILIPSLAVLGLLSGCISNSNGHTLGVYGSNGQPVPASSKNPASLLDVGN